MADSKGRKMTDEEFYDECCAIADAINGLLAGKRASIVSGALAIAAAGGIAYITKADDQRAKELTDGFCQMFRSYVDIYRRDP